jgi:hypothetical protein
MKIREQKKKIEAGINDTGNYNVKVNNWYCKQEASDELCIMHVQTNVLTANSI